MFSFAHASPVQVACRHAVDAHHAYLAVQDRLSDKSTPSLGLQAEYNAVSHRRLVALARVNGICSARPEDIKAKMDLVLLVAEVFGGEHPEAGDMALAVVGEANRVLFDTPSRQPRLAIGPDPIQQRLRHPWFERFLKG